MMSRLIFLDAGLLREVSLHHGTIRLDANTAEHHHLVCKVCRRIFDIAEKDLTPVRFRDGMETGFQVERFCIDVEGVCAECVRTPGGEP